ncbi:MAG: hypothetical protein H0X33_03060 [Taibaiella sp.]|nr:hypothetical protein [Taibaiella sp.]
MISGQNRVWLHYIKDIIAADVYSGVFLASYMRHSGITKSYVSSLEVVDLQRYKVIKNTPRVRQAIKERSHVPFVFVVGKN